MDCPLDPAPVRLCREKMHCREARITTSLFSIPLVMAGLPRDRDAGELRFVQFNNEQWHRHNGNIFKFDSSQSC